MTYLLRLSACLFLCVSLNSFAALSIRDLDGDWSNGHEGVYDDVLNITWLADANYAATIGYDSDGGMSWADSLTFASQLVVGNFNNWRLPTLGIPKFSVNHFPSGFYRTEGELGHLYYETFGHNKNNILDNISFTDPNDNEVYSFQNVQASSSGYVYWYGEAHGNANNPDPWYLTLDDGHTHISNPTSPHYSWPVHDGDIGLAPVPLPAGIYLFLSGLVGLGLIRGRNA